MSTIVKHKFVILLTGCVSPNGMIYTKLQDSNIRLNQYIKAIFWYLDNVNIPVVFVENTNYDLFDDVPDLKERKNFEYLTFNGNEYDKTKGKGYGEGQILKHALSNSKLIKEDTIIIKITGRLILSNIVDLIYDYNHIVSNQHIIMCDVNRQLNVAFSRVVFAPKSFMSNFFQLQFEKINDSNSYEFEHALADSIYMAIGTGSYMLSLFKRPYLLIGISGTDGELINNKKWLTIKTKYLLSKLYLWGKR